MINFLRQTYRRTVLLLVAALIALPLQGWMPSVASAAETGTWVDGDMPQLVVGEKISTSDAFPSGCYDDVWYYHSYTKPSGGYDAVGRQVPVDVCARSVGFGQIASVGSTLIRPNTAIAFRVVGGTLSPNPYNGGFYRTTTTTAGTKLALFSSLLEGGEFRPDTVVVNSSGHQELTYALSAIPEGNYIKDRNGDYVSGLRAEGYSSDGTWMVAYISGQGYVRINTVTRQMLQFDSRVIPFGLGLTPSIHLAISDDGNTVTVSGQSATNVIPRQTEVFDLSGCTGNPRASGNGLLPGCRSRVLTGNLSSQHPGFQGIVNARFSSDGKSVRGTAQINNSSGIAEYFSAILHTAGSELPPQVTYLALGDSFSSGEGAYDYVPPTDIGVSESEQLPKGNKCHLSAHSYPYAVAQRLEIGSFRSVACSGATSDDYFTFEQYDNSESSVWIPGDHPQYKFVQEYSPDVITISMIGNDIGFGDIVATCVVWLESCYASKERREELATRIYSKFSTLEKLYRQISSDSDGAKIYVLGYPQIVNHGYCSTNVRLASDEIEMARNLTSFLNSVIKAATQRVGVQYIDAEDALVGHQLCEDDAKAVNGLTAGDDEGLFGVELIGHESYHPNRLGHLLMAQALLDQSNNLTKEMPSADASALAPGYHSPEYTSLIGDAPSEGPIRPQHPVNNVKDVQLRGEAITPRTDILLKPNSTVSGEYQSTPTPAGTITTDANGRLTGEITVPATLTPGFHTLHLYAQDITGENIDLYKIVYVAASEEDIDGDGIPNDQEKCLAVEAVDVDYDRDGIDDACDPEIGELPADDIAPAATSAPDREPNAAGWYNSDVVVGWTSVDPEPSSGEPTQPEATLANLEGVNTYTSGPSCDPLNNCAVGSIELKIDKTAPDITYTLSPLPNVRGWHNSSSVTVTFDCSDVTSGIARCNEPQTVNGSDGVYVVTGEAGDLAGNINTVNVLVSLDNTAPTIIQSVHPAANSYGWNNTDVTITPSCDDVLSGIFACSPAADTSPEGANQSVVSTVIDNADNSSSATAIVSIDKTSPQLGTASWSCTTACMAGNATMTVPATDVLSGAIAAEYFLGDTDPGAGNGSAVALNGSAIRLNMANLPNGNHTITIRARDRAGNWSASTTQYAKIYTLLGFKLVTRQQAPVEPPTPTIAQVVRTAVVTIINMLSKIFR